MRLSVIVTCTQPWPEVRGCLERLVPQVRAGEIELIVADGSAAGLDAKAAERVRWLRSPDRGPHELRLAGLVEARGDVVAITEDHCDVAPDWCEKMLDAHGRYPDAVAIAGPVANGATGRMMDRASFFLVHGRNVPEHGGRPDDWFPPAGSNVSYKREQIMCGVQRPGDLELVITPQLWSQGLLGFDEKVVVAHSQRLGIVEHVKNHFHSGRSHAGLVAERGAPARRRALARDAVALPRRLVGGHPRRRACGPSLPLGDQTLGSRHERPRYRSHRRLPRRHRRSWQEPAPASVMRAAASGDDGT
jgi:Glycosyl transferase family 2